MCQIYTEHQMENSNPVNGSGKNHALCIDLEFSKSVIYSMHRTFVRAHSLHTEVLKLDFEQTALHRADLYCLSSKRKIKGQLIGGESSEHLLSK